MEFLRFIKFNFGKKVHFLCFFDLASALATIGPPTELMTSEVTARSFMVNWTHAPGKVEKYRIVYYPTRDGKPEEVRRRQSFQAMYSEALRFCTVAEIRQKWIYKQIILSQAFTVVGLNPFPCVQVFFCLKLMVFTSSPLISIKEPADLVMYPFLTQLTLT